MPDFSTERPQHQPDDQVRRHTLDPVETHEGQQRQHRTGHAERCGREIGGVERAMMTMAPRSSRIASVSRKILSRGGTRSPRSESTPSAKAMSVAAGIAQPRSVRDRPG